MGPYDDRCLSFFTHTPLICSSQFWYINLFAVQDLRCDAHSDDFCLWICRAAWWVFVFESFINKHFLFVFLAFCGITCPLYCLFVSVKAVVRRSLILREACSSYLQFYGGYGVPYPSAPFEQNYRCYSASFIDKVSVNPFM